MDRLTLLEQDGDKGETSKGPFFIGKDIGNWTLGGTGVVWEKRDNYKIPKEKQE